MAIYISNGVGVHSIEDGWKIPEGWSVITEAEAKAIYPELFGPQPEPKATKASAN